MQIESFVSSLMDQFTERMYRENHFERSSFDPTSASMLVRIITMSHKNGTCDLSSLHLSRLIRSTKMKVRSRLKHLSRYGILRIISRKKTDGSGLNEINIIDVNPILMGIFKQSSGARTLKQFVDHYFMIGFNRLEDDENDIQGFWSDAKYGFEEPEKGSQTTWQSRLIGIIDLKESREATKQKENFEWLGYVNEFVTGAGKIWTESQGKLGYGYEKAIWDDEPGKLGATPKRERNEIGKIFQTYGGFRTALAWYVYCCGIPQFNELGKMIWDNKAPHRQYVTADKKPSQFAKHFNAILADDIFKDLEINKEHEIKHNLHTFFGNMIYIKPRYSENQNENEDNP